MVLDISHFFVGMPPSLKRQNARWVLAIIVAKYIPILGTLVLIGGIIQLVLGFQVAAEVQGLRDVHMGIGVLGLVLILVLTALAFKAKTSAIYSKITMTILTIAVLMQVVFGFQILSGTEAMVVSHEATGFLIVLLSLLTGGITFWSAKRQVRTTQ
jgi:hypothetical protein